MNPDPEEVRLTAYALGELPASEAAEVEARLASAPEARQEVEEIRGLAGRLTEAFAQEASRASLSDLLPGTEQAALSSASESPGSPDMAPVVEAEPTVVEPPAFRPAWRHPWLLAAAASIMAFGVMWWLGSRVGRGSDPWREARVDPASAASQVVLPAPAAPSVSTASEPVVEFSKAPETSLSAQNTTPFEPSTPPSAPSPAPEPMLMKRYGLAPSSRAGNETAGVSPKRDESVLLAQTTQGDRILNPELRRRYGLGSERPARSLTAASTASSAAPDALAPDRERTGAMVIRTDSALSIRPVSRGVTALSEPLVETSPSGPNPGYVDAGDNQFQSPLAEPLSTFGLDVDTGSYANVRRFLKAGMFPPRAAVRVEEMINYFPYNYPAPTGDDVFGVQAEVAPCPWEPRHRLVRIAIRAKGLSGERPPANLVFLVDVSGSMQPGDRLPLLKQGLRALVKRLSPADRVAIVTYASSAGVRLASTSAEEKDRILEAIDGLEAGGSTNGEGGIRQAYAVARSHLIPGGVNRVLLCTDGDFNVGISDQNELVALVEQEARSGVFLTALGVGTDNFKDALMRQVADRGNGSYHYLDSFEEAQRVLLEQRDATFVTVARDAKAQVEFNPGNVAAWRLVGYEKRLMANQDFNDDTKDAGEIGAGQAVTVLYEIVPAGERVPGNVDPLKYQPVAKEERPARTFVRGPELLTVKLRYQRPEGSKSVLKELALPDRDRPLEGDFRFSAAVASFGMALRDPRWHQGRGFDLALELAGRSLGEDPGGWRAEFLTLVRKARGIPRRAATGFE